MDRITELLNRLDLRREGVIIDRAGVEEYFKEAAESYDVKPYIDAIRSAN